MRTRGCLFTGSLLALAACSSSADTSSTPSGTRSCTVDTQCGDATPVCDGTQHVCTALPPGHEVGYRDGTSSSVDFTIIYVTDPLAQLVDLGFRAEQDDELWVVGYGDDSVHIGRGIGSDAPVWKRIVDPAAEHFMHKPPALAMGTPDRWATCGDNDNGQNDTNADGSANLFMGPSLFSTDLAVFGKKTPNGLGSHEDMLHNTPFCRGIAHVDANIYWVFNAYDRSLDYYDFHKDHGPGNDDHSDGEVYRYARGKVKGSDDGTPSHVFYDADDKFLYVSDTGNARVVRLDTTKGTKGDELPRQPEPYAGDAVMDGTTVEEIVPPGVLTKPSGIEIHGGLVYVTDAATSTFHVFDKQGNELRSLATDLPPGSLAGFTFGADGKIYFTDRKAGQVVRIDTK